MSDPGFPKRKRERKRHAHIGAFNRQCIRGTPGITLLQQTDIPPKGPHDVTEHNHNTGQNTNTHHDTPPHATHTTPIPVSTQRQQHTRGGAGGDGGGGWVGGTAKTADRAPRPHQTKAMYRGTRQHNKRNLHLHSQTQCKQGGGGVLQALTLSQVGSQKGSAHPSRSPPGGGGRRGRVRRQCVCKHTTIHHIPAPLRIKHSVWAGRQAPTN